MNLEIVILIFGTLCKLSSAGFGAELNLQGRVWVWRAYQQRAGCSNRALGWKHFVSGSCAVTFQLICVLPQYKSRVEESMLLFKLLNIMES